jgi:HlyD family secretion protein
MSSSRPAVPARVRLVGPEEPAPPPPRLRRHAHWLIGLAAGTAVAVVGTFVDYGLKARLPPVPSVVLQPLDRLPVAGLLRVSGTLVPAETRAVSQPIAGQIAELRVRVGDAVTAGQVLARFDGAALRSELARVAARVVAAQVRAFEAEVAADQSARAADGAPADRELDETASVAEARHASASAEVMAQEAAYRLALRRVGQGTVKAPVSGVVASRLVEPGQTLPAGAVLFTIATDPGRLLVEGRVDEADLARLAVGLPARLSVPAYPGKSFRARLVALHSIEGAEGARHLPVTLEPAPADELRPGMSADVEIATAADRGMVRAPLGALSFAPRGASSDPLERSVWVADGTALRRVPVEVGESDQGFVELRSPELRSGLLVAVGYAAASLPR